jgi:methionine-S-sulfoxide reductase
MRIYSLIIVSLFLFGQVITSDASDEPNTPTSSLEKAIVAGGCFWCMESDFEKIAGVKEVVSGYAGGKEKNPTYKNYGRSGHIEVVQISYDPEVISYSQILEFFWRRIDPTDAKGQFCDRGHEYSTAIFYLNDKQKELARLSKDTLDKSGLLKKPVATKIIKADVFYKAEAYHQDYYKKNSLRYRSYRYNCGRDQRLKQLWGDK